MTKLSDFGSVRFFSEIYLLVDYISDFKASQKIFLCDENTYQHCYLPYFSNYFPKHLVHLVPAGDIHKNNENFISICSKLADLQADKNTLLINLGGGMVTDLGGFVASVYKRGIRFINIPTSTLAMADAAFGGKTGINLPFVKNAIGTFYSPDSVCIATQFIKTIPQREHLSGFAEIIKMMLLFNKEKWESFSKSNKIPNAENPLLLELIKVSLEAKAQVIAQDPEEKGLRKVLNYGHSVGHAIESVYNDNKTSLLHGEAIFRGMQIENLIASKIGLMSLENCNKINHVLHSFYALPASILKTEDIMKALQNDKKNSESTLKMALLIEPGKFDFEVEVDSKLVESILNNLSY